MATKHSTPKKYSNIMAARICEMISQGQSLKTICKVNGMPSAERIMRWVEQPDEEERPGFAARFIEARKIGWLLMGEDILNIADDSSKDRIKKKVMDPRTGLLREVEVDNPNNITRAKLMIQSRQWLLERLLPAMYGNKVKVEHTADESLAARLSAAMARVEKLPPVETPTTREIEGIVERLESDGSSTSLPSVIITTNEA